MSGRAGLRLMIYSQDGFGLGHLRRNINIAYQFRKRVARSSILIIADSPAAPFFRLPPECDFVKIPTLVKIDTGIWRADRLSLDHRELLAIRSDIIRNVALSFRPDFVLVDHMPHGIFGELTGPLRALRRASRRSRVILGLRDILGAPDAIRKQWNDEGAYEAARDYYDRVFIYGCEDLFDLARQYEFPPRLAARARYCGYVNGEHDPGPLTDAELGKFFAQPKAPLVLVTGGGGGDASFFMDKFIDAVRLLFPRVGFNGLVSTGPFMHEAQVQLLRTKAKGLPIVVTRRGHDNVRLLRRADLVISMAGYNTICEIMRFRKKAIVIPRSGPSAEQTIRSRLMSERGLFTALWPRDVTTDGFAQLIVKKLAHKNGPDSSRIPDLDGASRAAELIVETRDLERAS